jgi:hypothetical protein
MTQRSNTYLKGISETGDTADQTLFTDLIDTFTPFEAGGLGTFNPAMTFSTTGNYSDYTPSASATVTFLASGIVPGKVRKVKVVLDGSQTLLAGTGCRLLSGSLGQLAAGTYDILFASFDTSEVLISVPGANGDEWTSFNGTSNHLYFGNILDSVFAGSDKKFAIEVELRNWDASGEIQRLINTYVDTGWSDNQFNIRIQTDNQINISYKANNSLPESGQVDTVDTLTAGEKLRVEYDGSIDTGCEDRVKVYFDDVEQTSGLTVLSENNFPFDISTKTIEFSFGAAREPGGNTLTQFYNGDAKNLKVQSWNGSNWVDELNVPNLESGVDTSGNNLNGTWV